MIDARARATSGSMATPHARHSDAAGAPSGDAALTRLRGLLFSDEQAQLQRLRQSVEDAHSRTEDVSQVLAHAITLRSGQGPELATALAPSVEAALAASIRRDPQVLTDAIFPIIGPAIRKAIAAALQGMMQSMETAIAHSFSPRGLKWRLQAMRTGRPFAEIVLLNTLLYRVEQVFLIDRRAGLLLQHAAAPDVVVHDTDMVSGMLTAIQDFVRDSFSSANREALDTLQVGGLVVWIEQGPHALLAGVIRGTPPQGLRERFRQTIEQIHQQHGPALEAFDGDAAALDVARPDLEACLEVRYGKFDELAAPQRNMTPFLVVAGVLALAIAVAAFLHLRQAARWDRYVERLRGEPGLVITQTAKRDGVYHVAGLRDALAVDPQALLREAEFDARDVRFAWEPYLSLRPEFVSRRAAALLNPPPTVQLRVEGQILHAEGVAPQAWLRSAQLAARGVPGVAAFDTTRVTMAEDSQWQALRRSVEAHVLRMAEGKSNLLPGQDDELAQLGAELRRLDALAQASGARMRLEIKGHTAGQGSETTSLRLSNARADEVMQRLAALELRHVDLVARGVGASEPLRPELTPQDRTLNRSVSFKLQPLRSGSQQVAGATP